MNLALFPQLVDEPDIQTTGLLPSQRLEELIAAGRLKSNSGILPDQVQPCSIDLRLGSIAYEVQASFLPNRQTVLEKIEEIQIRELDLSGSALLERGSVYIIPLQEEVYLPDDFAAKANPKSSTGRLDVFTRLITDYGSTFEDIASGYRGKLYAEVVPLTFPIIVREGARLNQLRVRRKNPPSSDQMLKNLSEDEPLVFSQDELPLNPVIDRGSLWLRVDLQGIGSDIIGYRAKKDTPPIDLSKVNYYEIHDYWDPLYKGERNSINLEPGDFYILTSKEKVSVPPRMAAEMWPYDISVGEFRFHYAGFFDPGFGWSPAGSLGSHAVLEVRAHSMRSALEDGQAVIGLKYERLLTTPIKLYGRDIGSSYQSQGLTLSKHFKRN